MMATVPHVTSGLGLRQFQADGFLLTRVYPFSDYMYVYLHSNHCLLFCPLGTIMFSNKTLATI